MSQKNIFITPTHLRKYLRRYVVVSNICSIINSRIFPLIIIFITQPFEIQFKFAGLDLDEIPVHNRFNKVTEI